MGDRNNKELGMWGNNSAYRIHNKELKKLLKRDAESVKMFEGRVWEEIEHVQAYLEAAERYREYKRLGIGYVFTTAGNYKYLENTVKKDLDAIKGNIVSNDTKTPLDSKLNEDISKVFKEINRNLEKLQEEIMVMEKFLNLPEKSPLYEQEVKHLAGSKELIKRFKSYKEELCSVLASRRQELNNPELEAAYKEREAKGLSTNTTTDTAPASYGPADSNIAPQDPSRAYKPTSSSPFYNLEKIEEKLKAGEEQQRKSDEARKKREELRQEQLKFKNGKVFDHYARSDNVKNIKSSVDSLKENIQKVDATTPLNTVLKQDINKIFDQINKQEKEIKEVMKASVNYLVSTEKSPLISDKDEEGDLKLAGNLVRDLESYKEELYSILAPRRQELNNPELEAVYKEREKYSSGQRSDSSNKSKAYLTDVSMHDWDISDVGLFTMVCEELFPALKQQFEESASDIIVYPKWFKSLLKGEPQYIKSKLEEIKQQKDKGNGDSANKELEELRKQYSGEVQKLLEFRKKSRENELKFKNGKIFIPELRISVVNGVRELLEFIKENVNTVDAETTLEEENISDLLKKINRAYKLIQEEIGGIEKCLKLQKAGETSPDINYEQEEKNLELAKQLVKDLESYQEELCKLLDPRKPELLNNPQLKELLEAAYKDVEQRKGSK
jgi:hypothetical protein